MDPKFPLKGSDAVLQGLFENGNSPLAGPFMRWKMWKRWPDFVGPTMANVTEPVGLQKGTLYVWVKNSTWMQQVSFLKEQMRISLNEKLGQRNAIKRIQLTLNRNLVPEDPAAQAQMKEWIQKLGADPDAPKGDPEPDSGSRR